MTTGVEGCNKLAIAEFLSKFNADREPLDTGTEPFPAEAAGRLPAAPASGRGAVGAAATAPVAVTPGRGAAVGLVIGAGAVLVPVSAVVRVTCSAAMPDVATEVGG